VPRRKKYRYGEKAPPDLVLKCQLKTWSASCTAGIRDFLLLCRHNP